MSTGIETWNQNLLDIGPMYPFPGTEVLWVLIGLATWVIWHIIQYRRENQIYEEDDKQFSDPEKLAEAMRDSTAQTLLESARAHRPSTE